MAGPVVTVRGPQGHPVDGAEVWIVDPNALDPERAVIATRTLGDWVGASRAMAVEVTATDASGVVQLEDETDGGFLLAARIGALFGMVERRQRASRGEEIELQLAQRKAYRIALVDADGAPAAGVPLTLAAPDPGMPDEPLSLPSTAHTDAEGMATLYEPPPVATQILDGLDQIPERMAVMRLPMGDLKPIHLHGAGEAVHVTLPPSCPVEVRCRHAAFGEEHWAGMLQVFPAADGSRSDRTLAQAFTAGVVKMPFASQSEDLRRVVAVSEAAHPNRFIGTLTVQAAGLPESTRAGVPRVIELPLDAGLLVTGRCLDAAGSALANTTVDLFVVGDGSSSWTLVTDEEGRFRWLLQRPGKALAKVVVGVRARGTRGQVRASKRVGEVAAGDVGDLGGLRLK